MIETLLLLLLTGVLWAGVGVLFGRAPSGRAELSTFFFLNAAFFTAFVFLASPPAAAPFGEVLLVAAMIVPSGFTEVVAFLLLKHAMDRGSQGVAWSIAQSAMAIPFVGAVLLLGSPFSPFHVLGLALMLAALALFGASKSGGGGERTNDARFFRLAFAAFALIGIGQLLRIAPGHAGLGDAALTWRLPLQAPVGLVFWGAVCLAKRRWRPGAAWRHALPYGLVVSLGQIVFYAATDAADRRNLTPIVLPVSIGACILLFALYCRFARGERLGAAGWGAVALDVCGIALLSFPATAA